MAEKSLIFTLYIGNFLHPTLIWTFNLKRLCVIQYHFSKPEMAKKAVFSSFLIHRIRISYMHRHQIVYFIFHDMTRITALVLSSRESVLFPTLGLFTKQIPKRNTYLFIYFFLKARFCMPQLLALKLGLADLVSYCVLCIMYV